MNIAGNRNVFHPHDISLSVYRIKINDFNLDHSLSCGQVFRWEKKDWWTGIVNGVIVRAKQEDGELIVESSFHKELIIDYFRLDDDIQQIYASIGRDEKIASLINKYRGLRLIRQDPWECLISYMCSSNNTILNITNSIRRMCECFGNEIEKDFYSFPTPQALSCAPLCDMSQCRLGFRAPRVLKIEGVGNKIADCVLLFAFGKLESFPVDTHIEQIMERYYGFNFKGPKSRKRDEMAEFARDYFGKYCGYAQEYLYLEDLG